MIKCKNKMKMKISYNFLSNNKNDAISNRRN